MNDADALWCKGSGTTRHHRTHQDATERMVEGQSIAQENKVSGRFWIPNMVANIWSIMLGYCDGYYDFEYEGQINDLVDSSSFLCD